MGFAPADTMAFCSRHDPFPLGPRRQQRQRQERRLTLLAAAAPERRKLAWAGLAGGLGGLAAAGRGRGIVEAVEAGPAGGPRRRAAQRQPQHARRGRPRLPRRRCSPRRP